MWNAGDIDTALRRPALRLRLPNGLEEEYDRRLAGLSRRQILVALLGLLLLTLAGFLVDASSGVLEESLRTKLLFQLPVILLGLALVIRGSLSPRLLWLAAAVPFVVTVAVVAVIGMAADSPVTDRYMTIAGLAAFGANVAIPFKFRDALIVTLVNVTLLFAIPLSVDPFDAVEPYFDILFFMSVIAFATTILVYNRERGQKRAFLLTLTNERQTLQYQALVEELTRLAHHDPLTGAGNRRSFDIRFDAIWRTAMLRREQMALILIDIDHFKLFNDTAGHVEGDACLKSVAAAIARGAGCAIDEVMRYGGEEFALVLPSTGGQTAEAIRRSIEDMALPHPGLSPGSVVTVSVGKASTHPGSMRTRPEDLIRAADEALYEAKRSGRNRVVLRGHLKSVAA